MIIHESPIIEHSLNSIFAIWRSCTSVNINTRSFDPHSIFVPVLMVSSVGTYIGCGFDDDCDECSENRTIVTTVLDDDEVSIFLDIVDRGVW